MLLALVLGASLPGRAQDYKSRALVAYNEIVTRQKDFQKFEAVLPPNFPLGEGALVAYLENGQPRGIVVRYAGKRSGDWQEFYYRDGSPFFVYSKVYDLQSYLLYRNRFYLDDKRRPLGWEVNDVPQGVKGEDALLAFSRIQEDARQLNVFVLEGVAAAAKAAEAAKPSIVDAMDDPENKPATGQEKKPEEKKPEDPAKTAEAAEPPPPTEQVVEAPPNPDLVRWAAWANATRENKEAVTPFPAELVLGKIDVAPMPEPPKPEETGDKPKEQAPAEGGQ